MQSMKTVKQQWQTLISKLRNKKKIFKWLLSSPSDFWVLKHDNSCLGKPDRNSNLKLKVSQLAIGVFLATK